MLESLVSFMLPSNILSRFTIVKVESNAETLFIHLDEIASAEYVNDPNIESKGFLAPVTVRDFPIRDKAVDLIVRRRRWKDLRTGKCFTAPYDDVKEEGTRYSKEFAAFLKMCMERSPTTSRSLDFGSPDKHRIGGYAYNFIILNRAVEN